MFVNAAAQSALATLRSINESIETTANRIATGRTVNGAADDPTYWSITAEMRSDIGAVNTVLDSLAVGRAQLATADAGLASAYESLVEIQSLLVSAQSSGADRASLQSDIDGYITSLQNVADSAQLNDFNYLSVDSSAAGYNATVQVVGSFSSTSAGVTITTIDVDRTDTALIDPAGGTAAGILDQDRTVGGTTDSVMNIDISALTDSATDMTTLSELSSIVDAALTDVIAAQSTIGIALNRTDNQITYLQALNDAKELAVSSLVDANVEEEAAKLTALQTQQQLAVEALSIANGQASYVLRLLA